MLSMRQIKLLIEITIKITRLFLHFLGFNKTLHIGPFISLMAEGVIGPSVGGGKGGGDNIKIAMLGKQNGKWENCMISRSFYEGKKHCT